MSEGYWVLGFNEQPPPPRDPHQGANFVDTPDGAIAAVVVHVTKAAAQACSDARPEGVPPLIEILSKEVAGMLFHLGGAQAEDSSP